MTIQPSSELLPPAGAAAAGMTLVLFDCDGTLVDSQHLIVAAMAQAYAGCGLATPERSRVLSIVGLSLREAFTELSRGDLAFPVEEMVERYRSAFMDLREREAPEPMFPSARDVLEKLQAREDVLLGLVTGKARRGVARVLAAHAMEGWFATVQTADDAPSKPHPAMVLQAMAEMGMDGARTVVVGDTTFDMTMAKAAGAYAIGVCWGYHPTQDLVAAGADMIVTDFREIPQAVAALVGGACRAPA